MAVLAEREPVLLLMSVVVSLVAIVAGLRASDVGLRQNLLETLLVVSGGVNATPAYEILARQADSDVALALFTTGYATAMILTVVMTQVLLATHGVWS